MRKVLILGAAGNVGRGLTEAFYRNRWNVYAMDPKFSTFIADNECSSPRKKLLLNWESERKTKCGGENVSNDYGQLQLFSSTVEELFESTIWNDFFHQKTRYDNCEENDNDDTKRNGEIKHDNPSIITICYAAENGNRDEYAFNPEIAEQNIQQFTTFIQKLSNVIQKRDKNENHTNDDTDITMPTTVRIFYCGGSWTRRQPTIINRSSNDENNTPMIVVDDDSPTKNNGGDNPYERAKTSSYLNAKDLAKQNQEWCQICFIDYISVVPNFAPNFTIHKMVESAIQEQKIVYSHGDDYGRPLLHTRDAGQIIASLASKENLIQTTTTTTNNNNNKDENISTEQSGSTSSFRLVLLPGHFTPFGKFASIVKDVVTRETKDTSAPKIKLEKQNFTPDFLRSECISKHLVEEIGFQPDQTLIEDALNECAVEAIKNHYAH